MNETMMPYEETIDLKDLCVYILRKWRALLLAVMVGAVAFGGYKAISGPVVTTNGVRVKEIETLVAKNQTEITKLQTDLANKIKIRDSIVGLEDGILAKEKEIQTQKTSLENLTRVVAAYENSLMEAEDLLKADLSQELKVEVTDRISTLRMDILENSNKMVVVEQQIANLEEALAKLEKNLEEALKKHETTHEKCQAEIKVLEDSIKKLTEENEKLAKEDTTITVSVSTMDVAKFAILGAVAGGFVVCGVVFVLYFMDKKLRNVDELKERYGMRILGDFYVPATKKNKLDQLLDRMAGFGVPIDAEKEAALVAAKVQVLVPADGDKKQIIVTGTVEGNMLEAAAGQIGKNLPVAEYQVCVLQNPVYDAEALLKIRQGIVVLVEVRGVSVKKEIKELVDILRDAKATVLGVIAQ